MNLKFPEIFFGNINQYSSKLDLSNDSKRIFLIADENTKSCIDRIEINSLKDGKLCILGAGEEHKNLSQIETIWSFLNRHQASRNDHVYIIGGGVICDMGAFAASTYKRGVPFSLVPTSLLAMVDASVGGKTGFNFNNLKNNIGTFSQPTAIYCDSQFLNSLKMDEKMAGMAEVYKHAIIGDRKLWNYLSNNSIETLDFETIIKKSTQLKYNIVKSDPFESNERKKLNLGHTVGHAIESYLLNKNTSTLHGFAIAYGMILEAFISYKIGLSTKSIAEEIKVELTRFFKQLIEFNIDIDHVIDLMLNDKKNNTSKINFSLPKDIGEVQIDVELGKNEVQAILKEFNI